VAPVLGGLHRLDVSRETFATLSRSVSRAVVERLKDPQAELRRSGDALAATDDHADCDAVSTALDVLLQVQQVLVFEAAAVSEGQQLEQALSTHGASNGG
jgi:hypothetical protein